MLEEVQRQSLGRILGAKAHSSTSAVQWILSVEFTQYESGNESSAVGSI